MSFDDESWKHQTTVTVSRGKGGGYNVSCSRCDWSQRGFRDRYEAEAWGRRHEEAGNRPVGGSGTP